MRQATGARRQRGVSMVEFVIVFPLATLFVLTLVQLGLIYMAKLTVNHATFMAARAGALNNADPKTIKEALTRGLIPFYQDSTKADGMTRLGEAYLGAKTDMVLPWGGAEVTLLNPSDEAFKDFGVKDPVTKVTYIPNDNLEWRRTDIVGTASKMNIRDANLLKLKVVYAYEMKVPLIGGVLKRVMCSGSVGVDAYGDVSLFNAVEKPPYTNCVKYYMHNRMPIESFAIVEMQSRAERP